MVSSKINWCILIVPTQQKINANTAENIPPKNIRKNKKSEKKVKKSEKKEKIIYFDKTVGSHLRVWGS